MSHTGAQVTDAHGVAVRGLLVAYGLGSLEVGGLVEAEIMEDVVAVQRLELLGVELRILTAHVDEVLGKRQITLLTGLFIQLGEGELDLRMTIGTVDLAFFGAEVGIQAVGHLFGDFKGLLVAGHLMVGDGGLDVVTHHVHLVALLNQAEARAVGPYAGLDLVRGVQVTIRLLSAGNEIDRAVAQRLELGIRVVGQRVGGFLKPLVDVGILEDHAMELVVQFAGGNLQVGNRMALVVSQLVAGWVVGHRGVDLVVHHAPLVGDDGFDDLVATPLPERGSDCNVHDCPFFKALDHTASGPAIKDWLQPGSVLASTLSRLSTELAGNPPGSQPRAGGTSRQPLTAPAIKPLT